jgi:uncharacterized membrane protein YeiH
MSLFSIIDFLAVFAGALGGAAEAARDRGKEYDIVGVVGLGLVSALGGGITRDVLLNRGAPLALVDGRYLLFAFAGSLIAVLLRAPVSGRRRNALLVIDAAGLGLYAVAGSTRALDAGLSMLPAMLLGAITAAGGGSWRDVLSGRTPAVFQRGSPYVLVALIASAVYFGGRYTGAPQPYPTVAGAGTGFVLRLIALRFGWKTRAVRNLTSGGKPDPGSS